MGTFWKNWKYTIFRKKTSEFDLTSCGFQSICRPSQALETHTKKPEKTKKKTQKNVLKTSNFHFRIHFGPFGNVLENSQIFDFCQILISPHAASFQGIPRPSQPPETHTKRPQKTYECYKKRTKTFYKHLISTLQPVFDHLGTFWKNRKIWFHLMLLPFGNHFLKQIPDFDLTSCCFQGSPRPSQPPETHTTRPEKHKNAQKAHKNVLKTINFHFRTHFRSFRNFFEKSNFFVFFWKKSQILISPQAASRAVLLDGDLRARPETSPRGAHTVRDRPEKARKLKNATTKIYGHLKSGGTG